MAERTLDDSGPHDSDSGGSMFRQASDIHIHGGTFNAYGSGGRNGTAEKKRNMDTMALLSSHAEQGAPYDAASREDVPKCHEHTRVAIMEGVHKWANSQEPDACPLMWMYGPAGSGKTTIMQTVAETLDKEGSLAGSFFFSRLSAGRPREKKNFVTTLAHQLSLCIPALQQSLADALSNTSIFTKSLTKQMDELILGPLNKLDVGQIGPRRIFLVDGLDECNGDTPQRDILNLLEQFVRHARHPVRILVASRSLSHIRAFFSQRRIAVITATTPLDNDYQSDEDVKAFLDSEFAKIRDEHPSRGGLSPHWPSDRDIQILVERASGQFIYVSVVMKFIADHGRHPVDSLQTILDSKVGDGARPYEELDAVYAQVLSTIEAENVEFIQTLMGCLLLNRYEFYVADVVQTRDTDIVDVVFMLHSGATEARINRIHPLVTTKPGGGIQFAHASFPDYLLDGSRSKEFFLDMRKVHCTLACNWFESFSAHFKHRENGEIIPPSVVSRTFEVSSIGSTAQAFRAGKISFEPIHHCLEAEWTATLRRTILTFDVCAALNYDPFKYPKSGNFNGWTLVALLCLTFWAEQHDCLSLADAEHFRGRIQSELLALPVSPAAWGKFLTLLTWFGHLNISLVGLQIVDNFVPFQDSICNSLVDFGRNIDGDVRQACCAWLRQTMAPGMTMNGSFFSDGNLYSELSLQYVRDLTSNVNMFRSFSGNYLPIFLSKAGPSEELASFLIQNVLQLRNDDFRQMTSTEKPEFFMGICIYLFECGIPFHSEHRHREGFHCDEWICGVCLLFDPFGAKCQDIELSRDPGAKPVLQPEQIAERGVVQPLQINPAPQRIPRLPLLWLQVWILWLADAMARFFPVAA